MKRLFEQNLAPRLVEQLVDLYPGSPHVARVGLDRALDLAVWRYATENKLTIVTKDGEYGDLSLLLGYPPKVIWLRLGNCSTAQIVPALRRDYQAIGVLEKDPDSGILMVM